MPNASMPQTTASGLSGSPTLAIIRKCERSYFLAKSAPTFIIMRTAVGAVYQTVDFLLLQDAIPAFGVEFGLVDDQWSRRWSAAR